MNADTNSPSGGLEAKPPPTGQVLKHFRLERLLGEGGMGRVYRAYDTRLRRPVAVKLLPADLISDPERRQRFMQEARAAARVTHPAIAQIHSVDEEDGVAFLVMELVEGKTVRELIQSRELDILGAIDIALHVAEGLTKAHELGIVHRDIKPANVMLTPEGNVKILDFGLAKLLASAPGAGPGGTVRLDPTQTAQTKSGLVLGTPAYMSPEQVRGGPVDFRTDLFSLGVLLFEMTTGQSPFRRESCIDSLHAVTFDETPPMNSVCGAVSGELQRIVSRCLRKRPEDRYPNARMLAEDLRILRRETEAGRVHQTSWRQRIVEAWEQLRQQPPSRHAWFAAGVVGLGLALYLALSRVTSAWFFFALAGLYVYRYLRNGPHRAQEMFVRKVSKLPEVRLITFHNRQFTVVVDQPVAQLYGRISVYLRKCNQKLYFGEAMTLAILHEVSAEESCKLLAGPGVQHVRADVTDGGKKKPQANGLRQKN